MTSPADFVSCRPTVGSIAPMWIGPTSVISRSWEGDTLVIDVTHFNDETWLAGGDGGSGYFHSEALHVIERFDPQGDTLRREATAKIRTSSPRLG